MIGVLDNDKNRLQLASTARVNLFSVKCFQFHALDYLTLCVAVFFSMMYVTNALCFQGHIAQRKYYEMQLTELHYNGELLAKF